tara:strand:+ start:291 stop:545 length:255 start_codon:yes stop_codon:yes gene_type:complete
MLLIINYDYSYDQSSYCDNWVKLFGQRKSIKLILINFKKLVNRIIEDLHQSIMHIFFQSIRIQDLKEKDYLKIKLLSFLVLYST